MARRTISRYIAIVFGLLLAAAGAQIHAQAQSRAPKVEARFSADSVWIGDHFDLEVTVEKDVMQVVAFPEFERQMVEGALEILQEEGVDTLAHEGRRMTLRKKYRMTTFEEGLLNFGRYPVVYVDKNITDTLWSADSLILRVETFEIDTVSQTIRDIKPVMRVPLKFGEIGGYIAATLLAAAVIAALVWYVARRRRNLTIFGKPKPVEPPHVTAIKALELLHSQKLWQNSKHKIYYTRLTDILREYLEGRYGIAAMEMTSDEILAQLGQAVIPVGNLGDLQNILRAADLVKFAKYIPAEDYNETAYTKAYYFVEQTKPTELEVPADPED